MSIPVMMAARKYSNNPDRKCFKSCPIPPVKAVEVAKWEEIQYMSKCLVKSTEQTLVPCGGWTRQTREDKSQSCHMQNPDIENKERRMETIWGKGQKRRSCKGGCSWSQYTRTHMNNHKKPIVQFTHMGNIPKGVGSFTWCAKSYQQLSEKSPSGQYLQLQNYLWGSSLEPAHQIFVCLINLRRSAKLVKCTVSEFIRACYCSEIKEAAERELIHYNQLQ